jgi:hypothetical protein
VLDVQQGKERKIGVKRTHVSKTMKSKIKPGEGEPKTSEKDRKVSIKTQSTKNFLPHKI